KGRFERAAGGEEDGETRAQLSERVSASFGPAPDDEATRAVRLRRTPITSPGRNARCGRFRTQNQTAMPAAAALEPKPTTAPRTPATVHVREYTRAPAPPRRPSPPRVAEAKRVRQDVPG